MYPYQGNPNLWVIGNKIHSFEKYISFVCCRNEIRQWTWAKSMWSTHMWSLHSELSHLYLKEGRLLDKVKILVPPTHLLILIQDPHQPAFNCSCFSHWKEGGAVALLDFACALPSLQNGFPPHRIPPPHLPVTLRKYWLGVVAHV